MAISDEITRLQSAKSALKTSIEGKGVTVSSSATLDDYPALVDSIQQGGGGGGDDDSWYLVIENEYKAFVFVPQNGYWEMAIASGLMFSQSYVYFVYKGEKYYITNFAYDTNLPLSKNGQPIMCAGSSYLDSATITKDASDNFSAYFETD